jgi:hypothetical protein
MKPDATKSRGHGDKKPRLRDRFIMALLASPSVEAAAESVGINRVTAWRWMQDPAVVQRLAEARRQGMQHAMTRLQAAASRSVDCLCAVQQDGESESAKVSAARCILEMALRAVELGDVLERLDAMERTIKSQAFTPGPKVLVSYEGDGEGNQDGQSHKAPFGGTGGVRKQ